MAVACEKTFGFKDLYGCYLAERYLSFGLEKTKFLEWPWTFIDN